jgi:XTP/dITP diphosphohydrolase
MDSAITPVKILLASGNKGKVAEFREILEPLGMLVITPKDLGLDVDVEETGTTFQENARLKALAFRRFFSGPILSDDSGLEVDALGGAPGVYTARYAGPDADAKSNRLKLLKALESFLKPEQRKARFQCHLCWLESDGSVTDFTGECEGSISLSEIGEGGFGYDSVFLPQGETRTFAEIPSEEKHAYSHRGKASAALGQYLENRKLS